VTMKKTRKMVIGIASVLAVAGIASVVAGTVIKKDISAAKYMDGHRECMRYPVRLLSKSYQIISHSSSKSITASPNVSL